MNAEEDLIFNARGFCANILITKRNVTRSEWMWKRFREIMTTKSVDEMHQKYGVWFN